MEYVLTVQDLSKQYGRFKALDSLTMRVPKGAIYGFVGKNGAGKTTLIRVICGLHAPASGEYALYGIDSRDKSIVKSRRRMGAVVETPSIYLDMSAEDNLKEQYRVLGLPSYEGIPELLKLVGLEDAGKKKARNFSLGMKQRLGIAIALAGDPDFLVLDEPVNGLDPQGIIEIRELILKLNREKQITVLISSHILDELSRLATHYGFIDGGRMVKEISAGELEAACRKCMRLEVTDARALARVLDGMGVEYKILSEGRADVFARPVISKLAAALAEEGCELLSATAAAAMLLSLALLVAGTYLEGRLEARPTVPNYNITINGEIVQTEESPNPAYVPEGPVRDTFQLLSDFNPGGQTVQHLNQSTERLAVLIAYDAVLFVIVTGAGLVLFQRKDLR